MQYFQSSMQHPKSSNSSVSVYVGVVGERWLPIQNVKIRILDLWL